VKKTKIPPHRRAGIAVLAVSFLVWGVTFFALAQSQNNSSLFLDSDQDGLTDQEEHMIGTDPLKADSDGDGYSDGKEVESGYDPMKPAPGDKIGGSPATADGVSAEVASSRLIGGQAADGQTVNGDGMDELASDPNNPNLTNEMLGQLLQFTGEKASTDSDFATNPNYSSDDYAQIAQNSLKATNTTQSLPDIPDSELKILPKIDDSKLSTDEVKAKQKTEIEKYLAQAAFVFASNSPFPVQDPNNLQPSLDSEETKLMTALTTGDKTAIDSYAQKAQAGIDQIKKIAVPYVLKDIHKSMLQLSMYTLGFKDDISLNSTDPMKNVAAASALQSVAMRATETQTKLSKILSDYGIDYISFP